MTTQRITDDLGTAKHVAAGDYFNHLLLDLKKQLLGYAHEPIAMERLKEGMQHVLDLDQCREPRKLY